MREREEERERCGKRESERVKVTKRKKILVTVLRSNPFGAGEPALQDRLWGDDVRGEERSDEEGERTNATDDARRNV